MNPGDDLPGGKKIAVGRIACDWVLVAFCSEGQEIPRES
jgi:hypothetical protein